MIKLVVCDLDGTLIDRDEIIHEKILSKIKELEKNNILFTIATGRSNFMTHEFVKGLDIKIPYITNNGAVVSLNDKDIVRHTINIKNIKDVLLKCHEMGITVIYSLHGYEYTLEETEWITKEGNAYGNKIKKRFPTDEEWNGLEVEKISILDHKKENRINFIVTDKDMIKYTSMTEYNPNSFEIVAKNVDKSSGINYLMNYFNIKKHEVLTIGNHKNDIGMIKSVYYGVSVSEGHDDLKKVALITTEKDCTDGVIEAIDRLCFNR